MKLSDTHLETKKPVNTFFLQPKNKKSFCKKKFYYYSIEIFLILLINIKTPLNSFRIVLNN